jgi:hypothetical protein
MAHVVNCFIKVDGCGSLVFKKRTVDPVPCRMNRPPPAHKKGESCSADISFCTPPKGYHMRSESLFKFQINPAFQQNSKENRAS